MRDIGVGRNNWFEQKSAMQVAYALYGTKWGGNLVLSAAEFCFCLGGHTWQKTTGCAYARGTMCIRYLCTCTHACMDPVRIQTFVRENFCFSKANNCMLSVYIMLGLTNQIA